MAKKKTAAQLRRLQQRAEARGEEYEPPPEVVEDKEEEAGPSKDESWLKAAINLTEELNRIEELADLPSKGRRSAKRKAEAIASEEAGVPVSELMEWYKKKQQQGKRASSAQDPQTTKREQIAKKLKKELETIESNEDMKAKDRRSAKRKAEAIASEESGLTAQELLDWYEAHLQSQPSKADTKKKSHDPYIAFVGQLSFETTADELYQHIHEQLKNDFKFQKKDIKIRVLTDPATKKSRGMAFVEVEDPEILYGLLKLHQTFLNGRRINIERSAGGKKNSEARKAKIAQYRKEQEAYFADVVDKIFKEYKDTGELRDDELDEGVITLCKRHAGPVIRAAVAEYIEKGGRDMDNPSAYLTFLVTKFATEGIREDKEDATSTKPKRKAGGTSVSTSQANNKKFRDSSEFKKAGIDMTMSEKISGEGNNLSKIFPSARRGRGRGYM